jgi:hypothetical protein
MGGIRGYAWIHFASATLIQTSLMQKALTTADTMLTEFDKRFTEDGEALTPSEMERALGQFEGRVHALEVSPKAQADAFAALSADFDKRFADLRTAVATEINGLAERLNYDERDDSDTRDDGK